MNDSLIVLILRKKAATRGLPIGGDFKQVGVSTAPRRWRPHHSIKATWSENVCARRIDVSTVVRHDKGLLVICSSLTRDVDDCLGSTRKFHAKLDRCQNSLCDLHFDATSEAHSSSRRRLNHSLGV